MSIKIAEIFNSISGEWSIYGQGVTTTFLRLAGCNLIGNQACPYCDTDYNLKFEMGHTELLKLLLDECQKTGTLCITGGEPLIQFDFIKQIIKQVPRAWIETNGVVDFTEIIGKISLVVDYKIHHFKGFIPKYYFLLTNKDCIKFVIQNEEDFETALEVHKELNSYSEVKIAYSPVQGISHEANDLVPDIVKRLERESLIGYINLQIHKYLGLK